MITPDPIVIEEESGRLLELELGKMEEVKREAEEGGEETTEQVWRQFPLLSNSPLLVHKMYTQKGIL